MGGGGGFRPLPPARDGQAPLTLCRSHRGRYTRGRAGVFVMTEMRLVVVGAAGRMGRSLVKAVSETHGCRLVGAIEREGSLALGQDAGLLAGCGDAKVPITD